MTSGIYRLEIGQRYYYGSSRNIEQRVMGHKSALKHRKHPSRFMQACWNRHQAFQYEIVEKCDESDLLPREQTYLDQHFGLPGCLNLLPIAGRGRGRIVSEETRQKLSAAMTGRTLSEETKAKLRVIRTGTKHSDETKAKMSASSKGQVISEETRQKISVANRGVRRTEEQRQRMSEATRGRISAPEVVAKRAETLRKTIAFNKEQGIQWSPSDETRHRMSGAARHRPPISDETRKKMSNAQSNRPRSAETLEKMRESARASWQLRKVHPAMSPSSVVCPSKPDICQGLTDFSED